MTGRIPKRYWLRTAASLVSPDHHQLLSTHLALALFTSPSISERTSQLNQVARAPDATYSHALPNATAIALHTISASHHGPANIDVNDRG